MIPESPAGLRLEGAARDLRTTAAGATVVGAAAVSAVLDGSHALETLETTPRDSRTDALIGLVVGRGFRAAVERALAEPDDVASPLHLLLDDLPVAALISGYALLYSGELEDAAAGAGLLKSDICSGWRSDGTMMVELRKTGQIPVPVGPRTTELTPADDALAWHAIGALGTGAMRRRRLVEVVDDDASDPLDVFAMFRDTFVAKDGIETVLHEYTVSATLQRDSLVLSDCEATPRVLPWAECPGAAASAHRLDGCATTDVRQLVGREFRGTTTCTHLNDLLRSLADVGTLARAYLS
jgi:hypothetical protein